MKSSRYPQFAWSVLAFNVLVILWGAYVRATGSGAGCGSHWPLCNGEVIPRAPQIETMVEFAHRLSSGLSLLLVAGLFVWALRLYPKGNRVRRAAGYSFLFIVTEALIGAVLVLFKWVVDDQSTGRAVTIVIHLVNTFLLLASLTLTAWLASGRGQMSEPGNRKLWVLLAIGLGGTLVIGASGALTALGDTLFPAASLAEGLRQDFSPTAHFLIRLRVLHPTIAVIVGIFLLLLAGIIRLQDSQQEAQTFSRLLTLGVMLQLAAGIINVLLLAPVWMQIVHLLLADLVWIILVLLAYSSLRLGYNNRL